MPLNNIDYTKTIIYKIQHKEKKELFYVGHTTNFESRKYQHRVAADLSKKCSSMSKFYGMIRENGGWEQFDMIPIKQVECSNRIGALIEEQRAMDELKPTMNEAVAHNPNYKPHTKKPYDPDKPIVINNKKVAARIEQENKKYEEKTAKLLKKEADFMAKREREKLLTNK